jgi:hypothetical protein
LAKEWDSEQHAQQEGQGNAGVTDQDRSTALAAEAAQIELGASRKHENQNAKLTDET